MYSITCFSLNPYPDALSTTRPRMGKIVQHRTGHGPFVSYLRRFGKEGTPRHHCGTPQEPQHVSYCRELAAHRSRVREAHAAGRRNGALTTKGLYEAMVGKQAARFFPE